MRNRLLFSVLAATVGALSLIAPVDAQQALNGVWHVVEVSGTNENGNWSVENVQPSQYMFMDGFYSIAEVRGNEPRPHAPDGSGRGDLDPDLAAAIWIPYISNSGTYEVEGATLTTHPTVALMPNFMDGGSAVWQFERVGDRLHLRSDGPGGPVHFVLERTNR